MGGWLGTVITCVCVPKWRILVGGINAAICICVCVYVVGYIVETTRLISNNINERVCFGFGLSPPYVCVKLYTKYSTKIKIFLHRQKSNGSVCVWFTESVCISSVI